MGKAAWSRGMLAGGEGVENSLVSVGVKTAQLWGCGGEAGLT